VQYPTEQTFHCRISPRGRRPPFNTAPVADSQRRQPHRIPIQIRGDGIVNVEIPQPIPQPGMAERAIDAATDLSRTIGEVSAALRVTVDQLSSAVATARQPGKPLSTISAITREAPLACLFVAFLFGIAVARRR
jgi:hypothetical protein